MQFRKSAMGAALVIAVVIGTQTAGFSKGGPLLPKTTESQTAQSQVTQFKIRIENISTKDGFTASNGTKWTLDFSPGVWLIHTQNAPLFSVEQKDRNLGVEAIAEDGDPTPLAKSLQNQQEVRSSAVFNTAVGAAKVGGIRPGQIFEFTVSATPGQRFSLDTMFGQSNDWFYAPDEAGIALFDAEGKPISGDVTSQILLWNAGTEVDEEPGIGPNQGPRQKAPNTGPVENGVVQVVKDQPNFDTSKVMRVTIYPEK